MWLRVQLPVGPATRWWNRVRRHARVPPMAVSIDDLRAVDILRGLKESELTTLAGDLAERRVAAGDPVVGEGTGGVAFFFILEGETSVSVAGEEVATLERRRVRGRAGAARSRGAALRHRHGEDRRRPRGDVRSGSSVPSSSPIPRWRGRCCSAWPGGCARRRARSGPDAGRPRSWIPSPRSCGRGRAAGRRAAAARALLSRARAPSSSTGAPRARPSSRSRTRSTTWIRCARRSTAAAAPAARPS